MSKRAGLVTGGILSALGVVICVAWLGHEDRHAPHSALLSSDFAIPSVSAPFSSRFDARSESTLDPAADGGVHIHVHLPPGAIVAGGPAVVVTVALPDNTAARSSLQSGVIEDSWSPRIETQM